MKDLFVDACRHLYFEVESRIACIDQIKLAIGFVQVSAVCQALYPDGGTLTFGRFPASGLAIPGTQHLLYAKIGGTTKIESLRFATWCHEKKKKYEF